MDWDIVIVYFLQRAQSLYPLQTELVVFTVRQTDESMLDFDGI